MSENRYIRQSGLIDSKIFDVPISVIGAGGIGSFTTLALAKCGFSDITVWDMDIVEEHNLPNQFYPINSVGKTKIEALFAMVNHFTGIEIGCRDIEYEGVPLNNVVIMAVDSMRVRKLIWDNCVKSATHIIDGRMGGNQLEVYSVDTSDKYDIRDYKRCLWSDAKASNVPCTERAVMYNVLTIASWITNQVRLMLSNKPYRPAMILDMENMIMVTPEYKRHKKG